MTKDAIAWLGGTAANAVGRVRCGDCRWPGPSRRTRPPGLFEPPAGRHFGADRAIRELATVEIDLDFAVVWPVVLISLGVLVLLGALLRRS